MGKRLPPKELLAETSKQRSQLMALLETVPGHEFNVRGMNCAAWCIKDVIPANQ